MLYTVPQVHSLQLCETICVNVKTEQPMLKPLLLAALLLLAQKPDTPAETGILAGRVTLPAETALSQPLQVILFPPDYSDLWESEVQKRLDGYWERYKPAFIQKKEFFAEVSLMAYREATQFVLTRMRREIPAKLADLVQNASPEGRFEFKGFPLGTYKVVALGRIDGQDVLWQESVDLNSSIPQFLQLKNAYREFLPVFDRCR